MSLNFLDERERMEGIVLIYASIIILFLLIVIGGYYIFFSNNQAGKLENFRPESLISITTPRNSPPNNDQDGIINSYDRINQIPDLFPLVEWEGPINLVMGEFDEDVNNLIYITDKRSGGENMYYEPVGISGKSWIFRGNSFENGDLLKSFIDYYHEELAKRNWTNQPLEVGNYQINPFAGDSPISTIEGYLILDQHFVREIILSSFNLTSNEIDDDSGKTELRVFVSDPVEINENIFKYSIE